MAGFLLLAALVGGRSISVEEPACEDPVHLEGRTELNQELAFDIRECHSLDGYTKAQVRRVFGEPSVVLKNGIWVYRAGPGIEERCLFPEGESVSLNLTFDPRGQVKEAEAICT